ncbi:transglycosylase domain-containing protein [Desulfotalea psychrophila]|uniref:Similar to penicillin-binding protein 1B n=1 Tax=Desulfotalea psychrophila (strain LSv54 / DSM 12343) TaxID=177439 RepID=Q6AKH9_DESPS|nr:PBP1A family penicillin-binding protein [Desulfotalea psychrophila]CAG37146.1 similar to penicillin-binding protein 1B [Desulfotalea psychrophila LSv54]
MNKQKESSTRSQNNKAPVKRKTHRRKSRSSRHKSPFFLFLTLLIAFAGISTAVFFIRPIDLFSRYIALTDTIEMVLTEKYNILQTNGFLANTGDDLNAKNFLHRLQERGYTRVNHHPKMAGTFNIEGNILYLYTHANQGLSSGKRYKFTLQKSILTSISSAADSTLLESLAFPPLNLTYFIDSVWEIRTPVSYDEIPEDLINAVIATEDQSFFSHYGVDVKGIIRATLSNLQAGRVVQGGSTITQQLVKVLSKNDERSLSRKLREAILALMVDYQYSKQEILTAYLNNVYLGHASPFELRGIAAASDYILGKDLKNLNLKECAIIAGLIRSPNSASPLRNHSFAAQRTQTVLNQMANMGDSLAAETQVKDKLIRIKHKSILHKMSWYFDQIAKEIKLRKLDTSDHTRHLTIQTPLDPWMQISATKVLKQQLNKLDPVSANKQKPLQGATVILDPYSGGVKALVGGRDYLKNSFNRAVDAQRPMGSLIKPFIYLTALGGIDAAGFITQADTVNDSPITVGQGKSKWKPHNYDKKYLGKITIRKALADSRNIPAVKIGQRIGVEKFLPVLRKTGITEIQQAYPSIFLGAVETSPLKIAGSYATIANGGNFTKPHLINKIFKDDTLIYFQQPAQALFSPATCYIMTDMLQNALNNGTGKRSRKYGFTHLGAGKTGTTNAGRDSWFAGYTNSLVTVTWVGKDNNSPTKLTGSSGALKIWSSTMQDILGQGRDKDFTTPTGIETAEINSATGQKASLFDTNVESMAFILGTAPTAIDNNEYIRQQFVAIKKTLHLENLKKTHKTLLKGGSENISDYTSWMSEQYEKTKNWLTQ